MGTQKGVKCLLWAGDCRFPSYPFDWIHPLFCGPRGLSWPCSSCGQHIRGGGEAFCSPLWMSQGSSIGRITADHRTIEVQTVVSPCIDKNGGTAMNVTRALQVVLVCEAWFIALGVVSCSTDLWHSRCLAGHSDVMRDGFLSLNGAWGLSVGGR